jgi:hypothetical protein
MLIRIALLLLVGLGLWSGAKLSISHYKAGESCPILGAVPACYIALAGYLMMASAVLRLFMSAAPWSGVFWTGLFLAGGLALLGSALELIKGDICPKAMGWQPMCYVSLAFSVAIGVLYAFATRAPEGI